MGSKPTMQRIDLCRNILAVFVFLYGSIDVQSFTFSRRNKFKLPTKCNQEYAVTSLPSTSCKCSTNSLEESTSITGILSNGYTNPSLTFFNHLKKRFQGDFDNYHQCKSNEKKGLFPGEGSGHEHIHATIIPLSSKLCDELIQLDQNRHEDGPFHPTLTAIDKTMKPYKNMMGLEDLSPLPTNIMPSFYSFVLAAYYMDGEPSKIFRFRLYSLLPTTVGTQKIDTKTKNNNNQQEAYHENLNVLLKIYTVDPTIMLQIRLNARSPEKWENILQNSLNHENANNTEQSQTPNNLFQLLQGCNVLWAPSYNPKRHSYLFDVDFESQNNCTCSITNDISLMLEDGSFHAIMLNETGAIVDSMMSPGKRIRIQDELSLWGEPSSALWINDRGFDADSGDFIYGNRKGVPYKMDRVAWFQSREDNDQNNDNMGINMRVPVKDGPGKELLWTLGNTDGG